MAREDTQFKPGQSGNPSGRPRTKPWRDAIERAIARRQKNNPEALDDLAEKLLRAIDRCEVNAMKEFGDRIDGKVPTPVVGDSDHPGVIDPRAFFAWMKDTDREVSSPPTTDEPNASLKSWPIDGQAKQ